MAGINLAEFTRNAPDARNGALTSVQVTLNVAAGTITTVAIPDEAIGFRLYPGTAVRFAVDEDPAAQATQSDDVTEAELAVGNSARASEWTGRYLEPGTGRELRLRGASGSEVVDVDFF